MSTKRPQKKQGRECHPIVLFHFMASREIIFGGLYVSPTATAYPMQMLQFLEASNERKDALQYF